MRLIRFIAPLLCLAPASFAQLTTDQKVSDFMQLAGLYARNYAPYELRRDVFGFDLYNLKPWLDQVTKSTDDLTFYDICVRYVASLQDSHDEFTLPSEFEAWLHMDVDLYEGKVLIGFIDRGYLPRPKYPFAIGDEIVSVDGTAAADLVTAFVPYAVNGAGSKISSARLAAASITDRLQSWMPKASLVGDDATVVVRRQNGNLETYTIPWDKLGAPITNEGPIPLPHAFRGRSEPGSEPGSDPRRYGHPRRGNPWGIYSGPPAPIEPDVVPDYMQAMMKLQHMRAFAPAVPPRSVGLFPFDSLTPAFNPPTGFKLRLGSKSTDQFISGTFPAGPYTIGFIRIPTMEPPSTATALSQFIPEILFFQQNTDGLVIDVMSNGGGFACYPQQLASALIPTKFRGLSAEIRSTLSWVADFSSAQVIAKLEGAPQWVVDLYTSYLQSVQQALSENRGRTGNLPLCSYTFDVNPLTDSKGNNLAYTKPILVLTDSFTLSAAEIFTMLLQDNKRATIFGTRTDGGGGNVVSFDAGAYSEGATRITESLITRAQPVQTPGFPLSPYYDGMGIYPDIVQDYQTRDNLVGGGKPFVDAFTAAISGLIENSH